MYLQTDTRLNAFINSDGCNFMSIAFLANKHAGTQLSIEKIEQVYDDAVAQGIMDSECYIKDYDTLFILFGLSVRYTQRHEPPGKRCAQNQIELLHFVYPEKGWGHFVAGDGCGNVAYDPWGVSQTAKYGHLSSKRIFKLL